MNGIAHATIGVAVGAGLSYYTGVEMKEAVILTSVCTVSALAPDLDTAGTLSNKISFLPRFLSGILLTFLTVVVTRYLFAQGGEEMWLYIILALVGISVLGKIIGKFAPLISGIILFGVGSWLSAMWLIMIGIFVMAAFFMPHRSYTHSLIGLLFFWYIAKLVSAEFPIAGLELAMMLGYISHLLADSKYIPGNVRGVKLFLPIRTEF